MKALICLRIAMKMEEVQSGLYEPTLVKNEIDAKNNVVKTAQSAYQDILDEIVKAMEKDENFQANIEYITNWMQKLEFEICLSNSWNFQNGTGYEILQTALQICNPHYDFE